MRRTLVVAAMVLAVFTAGCQREESSPPLVPKNLPPGGGSIVFNDEINTLEKVLEKNPKDLSALIRLGNLYMDSKRFKEAAELYGRSLEIDPKNTDVRVDMGTCYRSMGSPDIALQNYAKAIEINPNHANAHLNSGVVLFDDMKNYPAAIKEFERFLEIEPDSPRAAQIRSLIADLKKYK